MSNISGYCILNRHNCAIKFTFICLNKGRQDRLTEHILLLVIYTCMLPCISSLYFHLMVLVLICLVAIMHRYCHTTIQDGQTPCQLLFPPGPGQLSSSFFLVSAFFFFHFTSISTVPCFSPSLSFIVYQFLLHLLLSPFSSFPAISYWFLFCPSCTTPPLIFSVTELFVVLILFLIYFFPHPSVHILCSLVSGLCMW